MTETLTPKERAAYQAAKDTVARTEAMMALRVRRNRTNVIASRGMAWMEQGINTG